MTTDSITPDMTLLDIVHRHRATEPVFRTRDERAGVCLLCTELFETVRTVAERYGLDLESLMADLERAAS